MKYIDADKLIAKIQPLYENAKDKSRFAGQTGTSSDCAKWSEAVWIYEHILCLINFIKQKQSDIDIDKEIEEHTNCMPMSEFTHESEAENFYEWAKKEFRYFYSCGLKAQKGE